MSLFSLQEICKGCENAIWHDCCKNFCHCKKNHEQDVNGYNGTCEHKVVLPQANIIKSVCPACYCMDRTICGHSWHLQNK